MSIFAVWLNSLVTITFGTTKLVVISRVKGPIDCTPFIYFFFEISNFILIFKMVKFNHFKIQTRSSVPRIGHKSI